jgi:hypothetical protein
MIDEPSASEEAAREPPGPSMLAPKPITALARRQACLAHRWDLSQRSCLACGLRIYVEISIS